MAGSRSLLLCATLAVFCCGCAAGRPAVQSAGPKPLVYVALGASDAVGVGADGPGQSWVTDLGAKLPPGSRTINLGISGETLHQALTDELPVALDARPDLVTIWLVVNDLNARVSPERYEQDLDGMLTRLQRETPARLVIGNVPDLSLVPAYGGLDHAALAEEMARWNAVIARQAALHRAIVVDLRSNWQDLAQHPEFVGIDGFHPSAEGYARLADIFFAALREHGIV